MKEQILEKIDLAILKYFLPNRTAFEWEDYIKTMKKWLGVDTQSEMDALIKQYITSSICFKSLVDSIKLDDDQKTYLLKNPDDFISDIDVVHEQILELVVYDHIMPEHKTIILAYNYEQHNKLD